ncbi:MAG: polysaccharide biosynthesis tyrosine autokinase [Pseudomonadota bacterium]
MKILANIVATLWRGKWAVLCMVMLTTAIGVYYAYVHATPMYRATAVLVLNAREERVVDLDSVIGGLSAESSIVNTEVEVLRSRSLLAALEQELNLVEDAEFNRFLRPLSLYDSLKLEAKRALRLTAPAPPLPINEETARQREATIDGLLDRIWARNVPQSLVFQVTADTTDPVKSARLANTLVNLYILNQLEVKFEATQQATTWLAQRVSDLQADLEKAEASVKDFRAKTDLATTTELAALEIQLKELRERIEIAAATESSAQERLDTTTAPSARASLLQQKQDAQSDRARLETVYEGLDGTLKSHSADIIQLEQLTREAEASRLLYEYFLSRLKETSAQEGIHQADSRVLSNAVIPTRAASPRRPLILALFALLGLVLGSALVLLREARTDTYRTAKALEDTTGYSVLGQIGRLPGRRTKDQVAYLSKKPTSAAAESVRNLRTSLLLSNITVHPQVIMLSSSVPNEGKTTVAFALAQNLAGMGKRVLLIEGDIRRQAFQQQFGAGMSGGLLSVLAGERAFSSVVFNDPLTGADILQGERTINSAADVFSSDKFKQLIGDLRQSYDHILIDTPPVLVVPDARIIAQVADSLLLVVKWDATRKDQVAQALELFESIHLRVSGFVLNKMNKRRMKRYGFSSQYGGYGTLGRQYYAD